MTKQQIKEMIMDILGTADYDLAKSYDPETAEEHEYAEENMQKLITLTEKHLKNANKKNKK